MARKELIVTIDKPGRDKGKAYLIREMSALRAEKWAGRVLVALINAGAEIPEDVAQQGLAGVAAIGLSGGMIGKMRWPDLEPLLDEMLSCIEVVPDPTRSNVRRPIRTDDDIEEVATLLHLRREVLELHLGFSLADYLSKSRQSAKTTDGDTSNTETSPQPSAA